MPVETGMTAPERLRALDEMAREASVCERCPQLVESRSQVVFGSGSAEAGLMFVGEAPGASEDREGIPFVGASGKLLDGLLEGIGLSRDDVFIANVLKCRPPENRDPNPAEVANCSPWLEGQIALIRPAVVVTLGNFATRLLRGGPEGIGKVRGREEIIELGQLRVRLYPVFHPAAALYRRPNLAVLQEDFARIPELVAKGPPEQPALDEQAGDLSAAAPDGGGDNRGRSAGETEEPGSEDDQLGLF